MRSPSRGLAIAALSVLVALLLGACSTGIDHAPALGYGDAGLLFDAAALDPPPFGDDGQDASADASTMYPATHADAPQVEKSAGSVMRTPKVVPVFYGNDPLEQQIEQFLQTLASSSYWPAVAREYGVGALTIAPSIVVSDPVPQATTDVAIASWLAGYLDGSHAEWPAIDGNTIYAVFFQSATTITEDLGGGTTATACVDFGGYHDEGAEGALDAGGVPFTFAVLPRCTSFDGFTGIDAVTGPTSHEIIEAATDPLFATAPAYDHVDDDHAVWDVVPLAELGDMCAFQQQSFQRLVGSYIVQRIWSNAAAASGADPCVPPLSAAYFNAAPDLTAQVALDLEGVADPTLGVAIPVGQSATMTVRFFSSGPTTDWHVYLTDTSAGFGGPALLAFSPSFISGNNGTVATVQVTALGSTAIGGAEMMLESYKGTDYSDINYWFGFVRN